MGVTEERGRKEKRKRDLASFEKKTHRGLRRKSIMSIWNKNERRQQSKFEETRQNS